MLTPNDIRERRPEKGTFGYKIEEIDAFLDEIADDYEVLYVNNEESEEKIIKLVEKINEYREDEDAIKLALLSAQKESKRILAEANAESERIITESSSRSEEIARQSEAECEKIINEHKERCAKLIKENTEATEKKIAAVKAEYEMQCQRLEAVKIEVAKFKAAVTQIFEKQLELVSELPDDGVAVADDVPQETAVNGDDDVPFLEEMLNDTAEEQTADEPDNEVIEEPVVVGETPVAEEAPAKEIPALKDESLFTEKREVKFSDLRFGKRN